MGRFGPKDGIFVDVKGSVFTFDKRAPAEERKAA